LAYVHKGFTLTGCLESDEGEVQIFAKQRGTRGEPVTCCHK